jgi:hypothetical protein
VKFTGDSHMPAALRTWPNINEAFSCLGGPGSYVIPEISTEAALVTLFSAEVVRMCFQISCVLFLL